MDRQIRPAKAPGLGRHRSRPSRRISCMSGVRSCSAPAR
jgi:hypothetical protein